ncbi:MAG: hypothetical protein L7F77_09410 [Candidatus Magnetominusculus sp. LBB02]|nr:hypothetical protein [Candidatus Magnetominusculus sp. LBB02]
MIKQIIKMVTVLLTWIFVIVGSLVILAFKSCEDDVFLEMLSADWHDAYYRGSGHHNKVKLDNLTESAFDIRERYNDNSALTYWLGFKYVTFSTNCKEVQESQTVFPHSVISPIWWPTNLQRTILPRDRSRYKFYLCEAMSDVYVFTLYEYYAIDNKSKKGFYWHTRKTYGKSKRSDNSTDNISGQRAAQW